MVVQHDAGGLQSPDDPLGQGCAGTGSKSLGAALRVLLVDDHVDTTEILRLLLQRRGFQVWTARSQKEALQILEQTPVDVLISDLGLPDGSGSELVQLAPRGSARRAIALSGQELQSAKEQSLQAGFCSYLTKPVTAAQLLGAIDSALELP